MEINRVSLIRRRRLHIWPFTNSGIHIGDAALVIESLNCSLLQRFVRSKRLVRLCEHIINFFFPLLSLLGFFFTGHLELNWTWLLLEVVDIPPPQSFVAT